MKLGTLTPSFRLGSVTPSRIYRGSNLVWSAAGADAYRAAVMADSPVAYWRLGETSGTTASDEIGSHSGSYINNPTLGVNGPMAGQPAVQLSAASVRRAEVTDRAALDITGVVTLEAWVKSSGSYANNRGVIGKYLGAGDQRSFAIYVDGNGRIGFVISRLGTFASARALTGATILGTGWRHIVAVYQPSTRMEIFINGASDTFTESSVPVSIFSGSAPLWLGAQFDLNTITHFDGSLAECAIYPTALSPARIAAHYAAAGYSSTHLTLCHSKPPPPSPPHRWRTPPSTPAATTPPPLAS